MNSVASTFNPARLNDQIIESLYATAWGKGLKLKRERKARVNWLYRKHKDDKPSLALADKLETCKPNSRCKSPACPECGYAARQLLTPTGWQQDCVREHRPS